MNDATDYSEGSSRRERLVRLEEAVEAGVKAASQPNAHILPSAIALALADRPEEGCSHLATIHAMLPPYGFTDLPPAFQPDEAGTALFRKGVARIGLRELLSRFTRNLVEVRFCSPPKRQN